MTDSVEFAHVFLFRCAACGRPLASACASTQSNLELADAHLFDPHCFCGWTGTLMGLESVKHWLSRGRAPRWWRKKATPATANSSSRSARSMAAAARFLQRVTFVLRFWFAFLFLFCGSEL